MMNHNLKIIVLLISLSLVSGYAAYSFAKEPEDEKIAVTLLREVERGDYKIVSSQELKQWLDAKKEMLLVDTMPLEDSYKKNHIPTAVQIEFPIPEMTALDDKKKEEFIKLLGPDKNRLIVFYCGFTKCTRSHNAAMWAKKLGYTNVYRHPGGIVAWKELGYPIEQ
ncbi:MAG TPA: rhodanese-like domain-containing protein [Dissulfurispiraceae bacterium]|nr:rhodanese-like domain-containing protein [Dissulfurispiraceae bacterium]